MQLAKDWETSLPHDEFMAVIRNMVRPGYISRRVSWSDFDEGRKGGHAKGRGALGWEHSGRRQGRERVLRPDQEGIL